LSTQRRHPARRITRTVRDTVREIDAIVESEEWPENLPHKDVRYLLAAIRRVMGMSWEEIADSLGMSVGSAKNLVLRPWWPEATEWASRLIVRVELAELLPVMLRRTRALLENSDVTDPALLIPVMDRVALWTKLMQKLPAQPGGPGVSVNVAVDVEQMSDEQLQSEVAKAIKEIPLAESEDGHG
jgi:hypothetical protein